MSEIRKSEVNVIDMTDKELKFRFFLQYIGQCIVLPYGDYEVLMGVDAHQNFKIGKMYPITRSCGYSYATLVLEDLAKLSDANAITLAKLIEPNMKDFHEPKWGKKWANDLLRGKTLPRTIPAIDFLRSQGYLLPYSTLSIDEILTKGWARYE